MNKTKLKVWVDNNIYELLQQMGAICILMDVEYEVYDSDSRLIYFDLVGELEDMSKYTLLIEKNIIRVGAGIGLGKGIKLPITYTNHERILTYLKLKITQGLKETS